jgi:ligand-binding sensor domain-containing protein
MARLLLLIAFFFTGIVHAPAQILFFNKVIPPEGKMFAHVTGITQDKQGYMWFASKKGLFRYNGYDMISFRHNPLDSTSLASDLLEAISIDNRGRIWIGTLGSGLECFDPATGIFTHFRNRPDDSTSVNSNWISAVLVDRQGQVWIGGDGLDRYEETTGKFIHYREKINDPQSLSSNEVTAIYEDRQGNLWIGTGSVYGNKQNNPASGGLNRMNKKTGKFTRYLHDPANPHSLVNNKVRALFEDSKGNFWVGTSGDGLHTMDRAKGNFQRYPFDARHPEKLSRPAFKKKPFLDHITFITEDVAGCIWIGTAESGVNYFNTTTKKTTHFELMEDIPGAFTDRTAWWAFSSRDGVLWISTLFGNLYRVNPPRWNIAYKESPSQLVKTFFQESTGEIWQGTINGLLVQDERNPAKNIRYQHEPLNPFSLSNNVVEVIRQDRKGNIWVGTEDGLNMLNREKGSFTQFHNNPKDGNSLSNDFILAIFEDRKENMWVGTLNGLNRMDIKSGIFTRYSFHANDLGKNVVTSIMEDRQGHIWIGCGMAGDVHELDPANGKYKTFLSGLGISCFFEDHDKVFWVGGDDGLFHFDSIGRDFIRYIEPDTKTEISYVRSIIEDASQNLWVSTNYGIIKINPQRKVNLIYGKNYGVNGASLCTGSCYKGQDGRLFFGTYSGYYIFSPDQLEDNIRPPQLVISGFRLAGNTAEEKKGGLNQEVTLQKEIHLKHNQNIFTFEFAAIDYSSPEDNRHLFMLENYDQKWNRAGSDRRAVYYNIPPGHYVFRVKASNSFGIWTEKSIAVLIAPPWWNAWWFRIGAVLSVLALLYFLIRWKLNQQFRSRLERAEKEKQLVALSQKTTDLEMQALRSQMNPHFIFNSLNSINRFILQNNKLQASTYLTRFSRLVRLILQNSQAPMIPLENELEALQLYLELESLRFEQHFDFSINLDEDLDVSAIKIPAMIIQPYVENAIWHGLMHKTEKGHLKIHIKEEADVLYCRIIDDGVGREKAAELKKRSGATHKSLGMHITAERMALLEQKKKARTSVQINDLVLPDGLPGGTEVILKIPLVYD